MTASFCPKYIAHTNIWGEFGLNSRNSRFRFLLLVLLVHGSALLRSWHRSWCRRLWWHLMTLIILFSIITGLNVSLVAESYHKTWAWTFFSNVARILCTGLKFENDFANVPVREYCIFLIHSHLCILGPLFNMEFSIVEPRFLNRLKFYNLIILADSYFLYLTLVLKYKITSLGEIFLNLGLFFEFRTFSI